MTFMNSQESIPLRERSGKQENAGLYIVFQESKILPGMPKGASTIHIFDKAKFCDLIKNY